MSATPTSSSAPLELPRSTLHDSKGPLLAPAQLVLASPPLTLSQATTSTPTTRTLDDMGAQVMDQDGSNNDKDGPWRMWTRTKPNRKTAITRLDRVSRPRALFLMRPLTKISVRAIPKNALANLLGTLAPTPEMAELATHRYDIAGNCIQITLYDQEHANRLLATTSLSFLHNNHTVTVPIEIKHSPNRANTSRGVITVEPEDSNETILNWIRCEQAEVLAAQRIGKTNRAVLTFASPTIPHVVKYYMAIVKVSPYQPKRMVCFACHNVGHMAKYCPHQPVCRKCGRGHAEAEPCERTLFCVACKKDGHLAVDPTCPARTASSPRKYSKVQDGVSWADRVRSHGTPSTNATNAESPPTTATVETLPSLPPASDPVLQTVLAQLDSLRTELQQLREENAQLKAELAAYRQGSHTMPAQNASSTMTGPAKSAVCNQPPSMSTTTPAKSALRNHISSMPKQRKSRSTSVKRTPTSQKATETNDIMEILKFIRADIQQERRARMDDMNKLRTFTEQYAQQTASIMNYLRTLPGVPNVDDQPPRKITPRSTLGH